MPFVLLRPADPPALAQPASPPSFDAEYARARDLANSGQLALALAAYDALLVRSPGNADVLLGRGIVYARQGRWREAEADLTTAARAAPSYADVWSAPANVHLWSGQGDKTLDATARLVALQPGSADAARRQPGRDARRRLYLGRW